MLSVCSTTTSTSFYILSVSVCLCLSASLLLFNVCQQNKRKFDHLVDACLRLGACQILFLDVAPHAAVKETVDVLRHTPGVKVS